jgi:GNAT superfamily N-acetyltransferase
MHCTVREISPDNAPAVAALSSQLGYSMTVEKTKEQIIAINTSINDIAYIAIDEDRVVAWIHIFYTLRLECEPYCEIGGLVVDEKYRRQGIGKILIARAMPWCRNKKCSALRVRSNVKRKEAHKFYELAGFRRTKQQEVFEIPLF